MTDTNDQDAVAKMHPGMASLREAAKDAVLEILYFHDREVVSCLSGWKEYGMGRRVEQLRKALEATGPIDAALAERFAQLDADVARSVAVLNGEEEGAWDE